MRFLKLIFSSSNSSWSHQRFPFNLEIFHGVIKILKRLPGFRDIGSCNRNNEVKNFFFQLINCICTLNYRFLLFFKGLASTKICRIQNHPDNLRLLILKCPFNKIKIVCWALKALEKSFRLIYSNTRLNICETVPLRTQALSHYQEKWLPSSVQLFEACPLQYLHGKLVGAEMNGKPLLAGNSIGNCTTGQRKSILDPPPPPFSPMLSTPFGKARVLLRPSSGRKKGM